jgi:O-antigen/teichoic acid export membrane protein
MVFLPSMTAFVAFVFFGSWILGFFGPDFPAYHTELILLSLGMAISAAVGCVGLLLALSGHERFLSKVQLSTTFAALGIVIAGTWYAGTLGAAAGTMIGMSVRNLILWVYARRNLEVEASVLSLFKFARKKR